MEGVVMNLNPQSSPPEGPDPDPVKRPNPVTLSDLNSAKKLKPDLLPYGCADMDYKELEKDDPDNKQDAQTSLCGSNPDIVVWRGVEYDLSKGEEYVGCDGPVVGESDPLPPGYGRTSYFPGGPKTFAVLMWCRGCCEVGSHWMTDCPNKKTEAFKKNIHDMAGPNFPWDEYHKTKTYHDSDDDDDDDDDGETNQTKPTSILSLLDDR